MFKLRNHNIILPKYLELVKKKGSSLTFSALGGRGCPQFDFSNGTGTAAGGQKFLPPNPLPFCPPAWTSP